MPIIREIQINANCSLHLWKLDENLSELLPQVNLNDGDKNKLERFGSASRKLEFVATRVLLQKVAGASVQISHDINGKPHLISSDLDISITHTKNYVGIILGKNHEIALDMEYLSDRVHRIKTRFLSDQEIQNISKTDELVHLYQHWCAKECLIKFYGKKDVHLIKELKIDAFSPSDESFTGGVFRKDFQRIYTFHQLRLDDYLLVYACNKMAL
ncbi:4'-phosphopantetheinyl transferase family protein [Ancylomarina longa]|uniref:4'-phosphopantetheinyl transferase superfamily protein n=1 Tax=Ancylomarina longa TaxID=2487017 RepID=A0A434AFN7_9BACT|nr:4'-phosphopantetheinyl transferase superfamily protein [Ancylomarina longa]RUT73180.1 4'-phosphopantetheinyl transferase superfamily protein [Ancylomarina longa]